MGAAQVPVERDRPGLVDPTGSSQVSTPSLPPGADPSRMPLSETERAYLCQRLDRLNGLAADLEEQAAISRGMRARLLLARAEKHRLRADRIRGYLRARGI
jgi:hypothetical protein